MSTYRKWGCCMGINALAGDRWVVKASSETARILPSVSAPLRVQAHGSLRRVMKLAFLDEQYLDNSVVGRTVIGIEASYSEAHGHYRLEHLSVTAPEDEEVTGVLLREVAPQRIMRWALAQAIKYTNDDDGTPYISRWARDYLTPQLGGSDNVKMLPAEGGPTVENIKAVAEVYRIAEVIRDAPAKAVADVMGLQQRTATNWINRARAEGFLHG